METEARASVEAPYRVTISLGLEFFARDADEAETLADHFGQFLAEYEIGDAETVAMDVGPVTAR